MTNPQGQQEMTFWELDRASRPSAIAPPRCGKPPAEEVPLELPNCPAGHTILRNMAHHILHGEPLLAPGVEGIKTVELINAMILSGNTGEPVQVPVDRARYDAFLDELKKRSRAKKTGPDKRVTDTVNIKA